MAKFGFENDADARKYQGFLDASTHLYKKVCPSNGPSIGLSRVFFMAENAQTMNDWPTPGP